MNVVCLVGRLIADPELRQTPQGTSVCSFTISVQRPNAKKDENGYYPSDLIRCVAWRTTGEFVQRYFVKGNMIGLNGSVQVNQYTDKDTGKKLSAFEVLASNVYFVESKNNGGNGVSEIKPQQPQYNTETRTNTYYPTTSNNFSYNNNINAFTPIDDNEGDLPF